MGTDNPSIEKAETGGSLVLSLADQMTSKVNERPRLKGERQVPVDGLHTYVHTCEPPPQHVYFKTVNIPSLVIGQL